MIQSMTGYGKSRAVLENGVITVEIRSVNSKTADIGIKSSLIPKEHDLEVRRLLQDTLVRGTIDMFLTWEPNVAVSAKSINRGLALEYYAQIRELATAIGSPNMGVDSAAAALTVGSILRMPDVLDASRQDIVTEANWPVLLKAINEALQAVVDYRKAEGEALHRDVSERIALMGRLYDQIEAFIPERQQAVRDRILKAAEELQVQLDKDRFEQEMIFYLEKLDINEERVRFRQHCKYFIETLEGEPCPGKKLGFILQEIGREINTTGSKANHSGIQQSVVRLKDELEKVREQSLNIL